MLSTLMLASPVDGMGTPAGTVSLIQQQTISVALPVAYFISSSRAGPCTSHMTSLLLAVGRSYPEERVTQGIPTLMNTNWERGESYRNGNKVAPHPLQLHGGTRSLTLCEFPLGALT